MKYDFDQLKGRNTIGANSAYILGSEIVKIVVFGDTKFFHHHKWNLERFKGMVVSVQPTLTHLKNIAWLKKMTREQHGLYSGPVVGWNYSTGAAAINLAVSLGAQRIFLLGYDLCFGKNRRSHWHQHPSTVRDESFIRFTRGFKIVAGALRGTDIEIFNVTDGTSRLDVFPKISFDKMERMAHEKSELAMA